MSTDALRAASRTIRSLAGLFDPYGRGRVNEPESECADRIARAIEVADAIDELPLSQSTPSKLWLWRNHVDGRPEYWAFDHPFPKNMDNDDPQTLGEPCGYALVKPCRPGRSDVSEEEVLRRIGDSRDAWLVKNEEWKAVKKQRDENVKYAEGLKEALRIIQLRSESVDIQLVAHNALTAAGEGSSCEHEWIDATNEKVSGTAYCKKCGKLAPLDAITSAGDSSPVYYVVKEGEDWRLWSPKAMPAPPRPEDVPFRMSGRFADWGGVHFLAVRFGGGDSTLVWDAINGWAKR